MVTVFTSCWNQGNLLGWAIESVLAQTRGDFEYLLYDDGSTDTTWDVMQEYAAKDTRIRAVKLDKQPNVGVVINRSFKDVQGSAWVWCPADDLLLPELIQKKWEFSMQHPDTVLYSYGHYMRDNGTFYNTLKPKCYEPEEFRQVLKTKCPIGLTGVWIPTAVYQQVGPFPEHLKYSEDFYWMLMACKAGADFRCVPELLYAKRHHGNRITERHRAEILANVEKHRRDVGWL
jgi:glycosyltransferase involved in cell wall biosynthesis